MEAFQKGLQHRTIIIIIIIIKVGVGMSHMGGLGDKGVHRVGESKKHSHINKFLLLK